MKQLLLLYIMFAATMAFPQRQMTSGGGGGGGGADITQENYSDGTTMKHGGTEYRGKRQLTFPDSDIRGGGGASKGGGDADINQENYGDGTTMKTGGIEYRGKN